MTEIARALRMPPSRAHRILKTLLAGRFVSQDPFSRRYRLGLRLFELGSSVATGLGIRDAARADMEHLSQETGETVSLGILEEGELLYLDRIQTDDVLVLNLPPGKRVPAHATALGKSLLSELGDRDLDAFFSRRALAKVTEKTLTSRAELRRELARTRQRGYALDDEEFVPGFRCVAAVVRGPAGEPIAAISVSTPSTRLPKTKMTELAALVTAAASRVSRRLGAKAPPRRAAARS